MSHLLFSTVGFSSMMLVPRIHIPEKKLRTLDIHVSSRRGLEPELEHHSMRSSRSH